MFTEFFFISLTWAIVVLALGSLISVLIYLFALHDNFDWTIRNYLDKAESYVKYLRLEQETLYLEQQKEKQED